MCLRGLQHGSGSQQVGAGAAQQGAGAGAGAAQHGAGAGAGAHGAGAGSQHFGSGAQQQFLRACNLAKRPANNFGRPQAGSQVGAGSQQTGAGAGSQQTGAGAQQSLLRLKRPAEAFDDEATAQTTTVKAAIIRRMKTSPKNMKGLKFSPRREQSG